MRFTTPPVRPMLALALWLAWAPAAFAQEVVEPATPVGAVPGATRLRISTLLLQPLEQTAIIVWTEVDAAGAVVPEGLEVRYRLDGRRARRLWAEINRGLYGGPQVTLTRRVTQAARADGVFPAVSLTGTPEDPATIPDEAEPPPTPEPPPE